MKVINKKIISITVVIIALLIASITFYIINDKPPTLILHNHTTQDLYIYTMQSTYGEEPTIAEVDELKKIKRIPPQQQLTIPISTTYPTTSIVSARWKLGSQAGHGDTVTTLIGNDKEHCLIEVSIKENTYKLITPEKQPTCSKKMTTL